MWGCVLGSLPGSGASSSMPISLTSVSIKVHAAEVPTQR